MKKNNLIKIFLLVSFFVSEISLAELYATDNIQALPQAKTMQTTQDSQSSMQDMNNEQQMTNNDQPMVDKNKCYKMMEKLCRSTKHIECSGKLEESRNKGYSQCEGNNPQCEKMIKSSIDTQADSGIKQSK